MNNENALSGYIKVYRSILDWEWFDDAKTLQLFLYLIIKASFKDAEWHGIKIKKGDLICSLASISKGTGLSQQSVRTSLNKLKLTGEITSTATNKYTVVTIVNYSKYQSTEEIATNKTTSTLTNEQQTINKQSTNNQQHRKNLKNVENVKNVNNDIDIPPEIRTEWNDYIEMRVKIKKPATEKAKQLILSKLQKLSSDTETQRAILNQSTMNNWQDIYALKQDYTKKSEPDKPKDTWWQDRADGKFDGEAV